jgi:hypothetical protein
MTAPTISATPNKALDQRATSRHDNALRWLRHWRERTINSAAPLPVDPFEELIHVACEAQEHVVLFEPERTPPTFVFTTKTGRQSPRRQGLRQESVLTLL